MLLSRTLPVAVDVGPVNLPEAYCRRIFAGEHPLRVWREFRDLELSDLRRETKIGVGRLAQIDEHRGKPISRSEAVVLARVFDISANNLMPHASFYEGCSSLDVDEDEIIANSEED